MEGDITVSIDMDKFEADAAWDRIKGYVTNTALTAEDVITNYRKWKGFLNCITHQSR